MFCYTRNKSKKASFWNALVDMGNSSDGVPIVERLPDFSRDFAKMRKMSFYEIYSFVFAKFAEEDISIFNDIFENAWRDSDVSATVFVEDGLYFSESFDDTNKSVEDAKNKLLPYLLQVAKEKIGSTNKSLFVGSANSKSSAVVIPENSVDLYSVSFYSSNSQRPEQLFDEKNFGVVIEKSEADIKNDIIDLCNDKKFLSSAKEKGVSIYPVCHSIVDILIRLGSLISSYFDLLNIGELEENQAFDVALDAESMGEIVACLYAKKIGIPISSIIVADNQNKVAVDFWKKGILDFERLPKDFDFFSFETLLFLLSDENDEKISELLETNERKRIDRRYFEKFDFVLTGYVTDDEIAEIMTSAIDEWDYVCSVSTARALSIYDDYCQETDSDIPTLIIADDSPLTDAKTILKSLYRKIETDDVKAVRSLANELGLDIPDMYKYTKIQTDDFAKETSVSSSLEKIVDTIKGE